MPTWRSFGWLSGRTTLTGFLPCWLKAVKIGLHIRYHKTCRWRNKLWCGEGRMEKGLRVNYRGFLHLNIQLSYEGKEEGFRLFWKKMKWGQVKDTEMGSFSAIMVFFNEDSLVISQSSKSSTLSQRLYLWGHCPLDGVGQPVLAGRQGAQVLAQWSRQHRNDLQEIRLNNI